MGESVIYGKITLWFINAGTHYKKNILQSKCVLEHTFFTQNIIFLSNNVCVHGYQLNHTEQFYRWENIFAFEDYLYENTFANLWKMEMCKY